MDDVAALEGVTANGSSLILDLAAIIVCRAEDAFGLSLYLLLVFRFSGLPSNMDD